MSTSAKATADRVERKRDDIDDRLSRVESYIEAERRRHVIVAIHLGETREIYKEMTDEYISENEHTNH